MDNPSAPDGRPPRLVTIYVPAVLALLTGVFVRSGCSCTWPERIGDALLIVPCSFLFLWPVTLAFYHRVCFVHSLFRHPPPGTKV